MRTADAAVGEMIRLLDEGRLENAWILASEETDAAVRGLRARRSTDAEDSASESLVRIFDDGQSALRRADPSCPLRPWLRGVITNVLRETRRSQRERTHPAVVGAAATTDAPRVKSRPKWGGGGSSEPHAEAAESVQSSNEGRFLESRGAHPRDQ